jgi:hypothetical protein
VPVLASVASLVVGMVLGALLFRHRGGGESASAVTPAAAKCPEPAPREIVLPPVTAGTPDAGAEAASATSDAGAAVAEIAADAGATAPAPADAPGALGKGACAMRVESLPPGALLTVDGKDVGKAPVEITGAPCDAPVGIDARYERFDDWHGEVTLVADKHVKVMASLRRPHVDVEITSSPPGATVLLYGRAAGKTPLKTQVSAYVRTPVKLQLGGYKDYDTAVVYKPGSAQRLAATLEKAPKGFHPLPLAPGGKPGTTTPGTTTPGKPGTTVPSKPATTPSKPAGKTK